MRNAVIFAVGTVAGAIALPASMIYIKPVRAAVSRVLAKGAVQILLKDEGVRDIILEQGCEFLTYVAVIDETQRKQKAGR